MNFLATTGEHNVLLAHLDQLVTVADAMGRSGTGGANRIVNALDLERRGQTGGVGAGHGARHHIGANLAYAFFPQDVGGLHDILGGRSAGADDQAAAGIGNLVLFQAGIGNRLFHRQIVECRTIAHEALELAIDHLIEIQINRPVDLGAKAEFRIFGIETDTGLALAQRLGNLLSVIADTGDNSETGNSNAS